MKKTSVTLSAGLLVLASRSARAAGPSKEYLQLMAEVRMLQEQNQQLQQLFGSLQDTLKAVTTKLDDQSAANRKAMADQTLAVNNIGDDGARPAREGGRHQRPDLDGRAGNRGAAPGDGVAARDAAAPSRRSRRRPASTALRPAPAAAPAGSVRSVPAGVSPQRMFDSATTTSRPAATISAIAGLRAVHPDVSAAAAGGATRSSTSARRTTTRASGPRRATRSCW